MDSFLPYQDPLVVSRKLDSESLTVGLNTVERERIQITGALAAEIARVLNAAPAGSDYGLVVRLLAESLASAAFFKLTDGVEIATITPAGEVNITGNVDIPNPVDVTGSTVIVGASALPTGAATAANQLPDGHNVTVDNAAGAAAVNIQDGGNVITVDGSVTIASLHDTGNSTTTPLASDGVFTGTGIDVSNYPSFTLSIFANTASNLINGLQLQWGPDGTNWEYTVNIVFVAAPSRAYHLSHRGRFFRVVYTNTNSAQATFRLDVVHKAIGAKADGIYPEDEGHIHQALGQFILGVRNDNAGLTFANANFDYSPIGVDDRGRVGITTQGDPIEIIGDVLETNSASIASSLSTISNAIELTRMKVNPIAGQIGVQGGAGASTALTQRVAIATDANTVVVSGIAHDSPDSGNPVKIGGRAKDTQGAAVAVNDRTDQGYDRHGAAFTRSGHQAPAGVVLVNSSEPAENTQATTTRAAAIAGTRHVCTGITAVLAAGTVAPAAIKLSVFLRDGASGAGTILWRSVISLPATAGAMNGITRSGLWIPGSGATAMTLEFSAAGGANTFQSVSMELTDIVEDA